MKRKVLILTPFLMLCLTVAAVAQQSNKSKSKDRYREKELPQKSERVRNAEQNAGWSKLAAGQLRAITTDLAAALTQSRLSAPETARAYGYILLAGHEAAARYEPKGFPTLQGSVRSLPVLYSFTAADSVYYPLAALLAILETGKSMLPMGQLLSERQVRLEQAFRAQGLPEVFIAGSKSAAAAISSGVAVYSAKDDYLRLAAASQGKAGAPYWDGVQPFFLESAKQFQPAMPVPFDVNPGSRFMGLVREVYETGRNLTPQQRETAGFWNGTVAAASHWMNICASACEQQQRSFRESLVVQTALALALADAYIACWDEKYRSSRPHPKTAINQLIDPAWQPLLSSASPDPEYPSELSVVSGAAAEVLTYFLGDNKAFVDNTGTSRRFLSFRQAAGEASLSGLSGGIQFRDAVEEGLATGRKLGLWVLSRLPVKQ